MDDTPMCPICGEECETIYRVKDTKEVIGCDCCIEAIESWPWFNEQTIDDEAVKADYYYDYMKDMRHAV